jgi:sugar phosphate permease
LTEPRKSDHILEWNSPHWRGYVDTHFNVSHRIGGGSLNERRHLRGSVAAHVKFERPLP